jgi:hypothetical protein
MNKKVRDHRILTHKIMTTNHHGNPTTMYTSPVDDASSLQT